MHAYLVTMEITPLKIDSTHDMLPLHCTLVHWFWLKQEPEEAAKSLNSMNSEVMSYDRDVEGLPIEGPQFTFPGDEVISSNAYAAAMSNTYLRKLPFGMMLMERFGLPSNPENQERIKRGLVCMGWLDHMLDEAPDRKASLQAYTGLVSTLAEPKEHLCVPSWIRPEVLDSVALLRNAIDMLPQKNKATIVRKAQRIGAISLEKSSTKNAADYCKVLSEEGALSSDVVIECLSVRIQETARYKHLHGFNARAMTAATLLDAAIDLRQDYNDGLTNVAPSFSNRFLIYKKAFSHVPYIIKNIGANSLRIRVDWLSNGIICLCCKL